jgi:hypothetical protein
MYTSSPIRCILSALLLASVPLVPTLGATATWNGAIGNWSDATQWSPAVVPNNNVPAGTTYDVTIPGGTVSLTIAPTVQNLTLSGGTLTGTNSLSVVNTFTALGDTTLDGSGALNAANLTLAPYSITANGTRSLTSSGSASWNAADAFPQFITFSPTNTYTNNGTFTLNPAEGSSWYGGAFINNGSLTKLGNTSVFLLPGLTNNGSISVNAGELTLNYGIHRGSFSTAAAGSLTFTGTNTFTAGSVVGGNVLFADDASFTGSTVTGNLTFNYTAAVNAGTKLNTTALNVMGGDVVLNTGGASSTAALTIDGATNAWTGRVDLTSDALIIRPTAATKATVAATLRNQVDFGKNRGTGGLYTGEGITSSTLAAAATAGTLSSAVVLADNADLKLTSYRGQTGLDANSLILTIAHLGDATLDGKVDAFDLNLLAAHWQQQAGAFWSGGDFNNDGKVDAFDLNVLASNWQFGATSSLPFSAALAALPVFGGAAPVPEPATLALVPGAAAALLLRRRRRPG